MISWADDKSVHDARTVPALIDTGATSCVIDDNLAQELGLSEIGTHTFFGVSGKDTRPRYLTTVAVTEVKHLIHEPMGGVDLSGGTYQVLLGRDFLRHFMLIYDGRTGLVVVSNDLSPTVPQGLAQALAKLPPGSST